MCADAANELRTKSQNVEKAVDELFDLLVVLPEDMELDVDILEMEHPSRAETKSGQFSRFYNEWTGHDVV